MNIMQAFHGLTRIAVRLHGGRTADYDTPVTWKCAVHAVRMQADIESLMRAHLEYGQCRIAVAAARMVHSMRTAAVR